MVRIKGSGKGRPCLGSEPKVNRLFSIDEGVYGIFKLHCKINKVSMSQIVQELMHSYNVRNANKP